MPTDLSRRRENFDPNFCDRLPSHLKSWRGQYFDQTPAYHLSGRASGDMNPRDPQYGASGQQQSAMSTGRYDSLFTNSNNDISPQVRQTKPNGRPCLFGRESLEEKPSWKIFRIILLCPHKFKFTCLMAGAIIPSTHGNCKICCR